MHLERIYKPDIECQLRAIVLILGIRVRHAPQKKQEGRDSKKM
ncbi:MAG TPA: hypothetical protein VGT44_02980 [Ktedonobacteraceae bacterium]|nr:hypothetical protein [Ktedonobacteraceae bacterium]